MQQHTSSTQSNNHYWKKVSFDFALVVSALVLAFAASSYFNLSDQFYRWAMQHEDTWDIDELPLVLLVYFTGLLWFANRRMRESSRLIKENHALLQRVLNVQETERKRLAQDLHDELGQYLNAIKVQATRLLHDSKISETTSDTTHLIVKTAEHGYQSARQIMQSLRPVALDECGLSGALEHLINSWRAAKQTNSKPNTVYTLKIENDIDHFNESINIAVFRIVQEALTNIAKHACANQVTVSISHRKEQLHIEIKDNGLGFDLNSKTHGYGLLGMRERTQALLGSFTLSSTPNQGTEIYISLPASDLQGNQS